MRGTTTYGLVIALVWSMLFCSPGQAQQDPLYTQYQFNKLAINPAYAGSREGFSLTAVYRDQWTGIQGAPQTVSLAMHAPVGGRFGLGFHMLNDRLGVIDETGAWGSFAFRVPAGSGEFSIGLNAGLSYFRTNMEGVFLVDADDPVFAADQSLWLPNVGLGIYFHGERYYLGVAAPRLIDNDLRETSSASSGAQSARQARHFNLMAGLVFDLGESVKMRPAGLIRYVANAPIEAEVNLSALFLDQFWVGAGYRSGGTAAFNLEYNVTSALRLGYSYDLVLHGLSSQTGGSHEFLLGIDLGTSVKPVSSPRQFVPQYF